LKSIASFRKIIIWTIDHKSFQDSKGLFVQPAIIIGHLKKIPQ
jgi:hypothetical protein